MDGLLNAAIATLSILLTATAWCAVLAGVGLLASRLTRVTPTRLEQVLLLPWLGFAWTIVILIVWNMARPIDDLAVTLVVVAGMVGLYQGRAVLESLFLAIRWPVVIAVSTVVALWVSNVALSPLTNWDSQLYHVQAVRWATSYPAVPGIANLFGPLAFNNSSFLFGALLDVGVWEGRSWLVMNAALVIATIPLGAWAVAAVRTGDRAERVIATFWLVLLTLVVMQVTPDNLASYITDVPTTLVMVVACGSIFTLLVRLRESGPAEASARLLACCTLLACAVTLKMHTGAFAAAAWFTLVVAWWRHGGRASQSRIPTLAAAVVIPAIFAVAWMSRSVILSGYPLFPNPVAGLDVSWRTPVEHAQAEYAYIVHSGRATATLLGVVPGVEQFSVWFPRWLRHAARVPHELLVPLGLVVVGLLLRMRRRASDRGATGAGALLLLPALVAVVTWFSVAPEPRYAAYACWAMAGVLLASPLSEWGSRGPRRAVSLRASLVLLLVSPAVTDPVRVAFEAGTNPAMEVLRRNLNRPPDGELFPHLPQTAADTFETRFGLHVAVPADEGGRCLDVPIPCTPNPASNVRERVPGDIRNGFETDSSWQMQDFPYRWLPRFLTTWRQIEARGPA